MVYLELRFPVIGTALPSDHGYTMFSAIAKIIPEVHDADWIAVETIPGFARGDGATQLNARARLRMRLPQERLPLMLMLAGKRLVIATYNLRIGIPRVNLLRPSESLYARCVTIKHAMEPESFLMAVGQKLEELGVRGEPEVGARRILRVADHKIVGFGLTIRRLDEQGSLLLQERGIGGRRHFGCGYFIPIPG
jgi:CRISPR-associated endonuclease/helicase Cas3